MHQTILCYSSCYCSCNVMKSVIPCCYSCVLYGQQILSEKFDERHEGNDSDDQHPIVLKFKGSCT